MEFSDFDNQKNDDCHEDNNQSTQDHTRQICYFIKQFYNRDDEMDIFT